MRGALALAIVAACVGGCAPAQGEAITQATWWQLNASESSADLGEPPTAPVLLRLTSGKIETLTACSVYSASLKSPTAGPQEVDSGSGNPVGCQPAQMAFDARYLGTLEETTAVAQGADGLELSGVSGSLAFRPARLTTDALPEADSTWQLQGISFNGKLRAAITDPPARIVWGQSSISGSTSCRDFQLAFAPPDSPVEWATDVPGTQIAFDERIGSEAACTDPVAKRQDGWLRGVLRDDVVVAFSAQFLTLTNRETTAVYRAVS